MVTPPGVTGKLPPRGNWRVPEGKVSITFGGIAGEIQFVGEIAAGGPIEAYQDASESMSVPDMLAPSGDAYVLKVRGNLYYGSLPVVESTFHSAVARTRELTIDFSECYYIDQEGLRWLASTKARHKVTFTDRRSGDDRRQGERRTEGDRKRMAG